MTVKITRVEKHGIRSYDYEKDGVQLNGISVTTFLDLFKDSSWKDKYWYPSIRKNVENADFYTSEDLQELVIEKSKQISRVAADHGTDKHSTVEKYKKGECEIDAIVDIDLRKLLDISRSVECEHFKSATELPVFYSDDTIQIGGTLDDLLNVNCNYLYDKETNFELANERRNFIIDWKFPQYPKYGDANLGYMVQLAIYRLGLNYSYGLQFDDAMIVMTPKYTSNKKEKLCKITYLYYLDKESLDYFSQQFFKMAEAYKEGACWLFDWNAFAKQAKDEEYLAKRIYLL